MPDYFDPEQPKVSSSPEKLSKAEEEKILEESKKRFTLCEEAEKDLRALALDDLRFRAGDQWDEQIKQRRVQQRKPCLTINVLPARERQILNEQRQNRPAIQVNPVDDKADPDTADVLQGIIRHIEYDSDADVAYDTASASSTRIGFGYLRLLTEHESPTSFQQVIKIERIRNAFMVYLDPSCQKADGSDANFGYIFETLTKDEFEDLYPKSELAGLDSWDSVGNRDPGWLSDEGVRIVEYFYRENKDDNLLLIENLAGEQRGVLETDFEKMPPRLKKRVKIIDQRTTQVPVIHWCKHNAVEVLEKTVWPGKWVPIIPIYGDELDVDGKRVLEGMVRHAKDPMRMQNVMASEEVTAIGLAPKAPFIAAAGQTEDFPEWETANTEMHAVLRYKPIDVGGNPLPAPGRNAVEPPIAAISQARLQFADDLKAVTGIYDAQLGARSNEQSGRAISQRKSQGELSNFHYVDNLTRGLKFLGRQLIDLIPKIYNTPQMIRIIGEDGAQKVVKVNQEFQLEDGSTKKYDLTVGRYDVTVSTTNYETRRQLKVDSILELTRSYPPLAQVAGDILVGSMDFPDHEKLAERLKKLINQQFPGMTDDDAESDPKLKLQQTQAQLQAISQQHQMLTDALNKANDVIKTKQVEAQSKERIAQLEMETKIAIAEIQTKAQDAQRRAEIELNVWKELHGAAHETALAVQQHGQNLEATQQAAQQTPPNGPNGSAPADTTQSDEQTTQ